MLAPEGVSEREYSGGSRAVVVEHECIEGGRCEEVCQLAAVKDHKVDDRRCEAYSMCAVVCFARAVTMQPQTMGHVYISRTRYRPLIHAHLLARVEPSGKLVTEVRRLAQEVAEATAEGVAPVGWGRRAASQAVQAVWEKVMPDVALPI